MTLKIFLTFFHRNQIQKDSVKLPHGTKILQHPAINAGCQEIRDHMVGNLKDEDYYKGLMQKLVANEMEMDF